MTDALTPIEDLVKAGEEWSETAVIGISFASDAGEVFGLKLWLRKPGALRWRKSGYIVWDNKSEGAGVLLDRLRERLGRETPR